MAKYKFNVETLSYEKDRDNFKVNLRSILVTAPVSIVIAFIIAFGTLKLYKSGRLESEKLKNEKLMAQYELMSKNIEDIELVLNDLQERDDNLYRVVFEADQIPASIRKAGFGGVDRYKDLEKLDASQLVRDAAKKLDVVTKQAYIQSKSYEELAALAVRKEEMLECIPAIMPISNKDLKRTASGWGYRIDPVYKIRKFHQGMDFAAPVGTKIYAAGNGTVIRASHSSRGYGNCIVVDHGYGYKTLYAHQSRLAAKVGDKVKRGELIGYVGSTGKSTGAHLHYEVHKDNKAVNPQHYYFKDLTPEEFDQMVTISNNIGQSLD